MKRHRKRNGPSAWQASAEWRSIASRAIRRWNVKRRHLPKCGARRRSDGEPCQQTAMSNGRCYWHSGGVPRGDQWHVAQWPDPKSPNAMEKLNYKLAAKQKEAAARERKLRMMPADKKTAHAAWQRSHKPGSANGRQHDREMRRQARETRARVRAWELEAAIREGKGVFG